MSSFFIFRNAFMTRSDFLESGSVIIFGILAGTTCHDTVFILEPAAWSFFTVLGQLAPEVIDLGLRLAAYLQRYRLVELEVRAAVQRGECLSLDLEFDNHHRTGWLVMNITPRFGVAADLAELRVLEDRAIELCRLLGFGVEPETRCDPL